MAVTQQLKAQKLGGRWVIFDEPVPGKKATGRRLSQSSFDSLALSLEGIPQELTPDQRRHVKARIRKIRQEKIAWAESHVRRAQETIKTYSASPEVVQELSTLTEVLATGTSNRMTHVFGNMAHAYVPEKKLRKIELIYKLKEVPQQQANVIFRVVEHLPRVSKLRLVCDLIDEQDPRAYKEATRLLNELLEGSA